MLYILTMKNKLIILLLIASAGFAKAQNMTEWHGYAQLRASSNFDNNSGFALRRMKVWFKSTPDFSKKWSYKLQTTITSFQQQKFLLQDVKLGYKAGLFKFNFGQFKPAYSLQMFQFDYKIPAIERANVINRLYVNGSLDFRDIGMQMKFENKTKLFETYIGLFNGYGIKEYRFSNNGFMVTHKSSLNFNPAKSKIKLGYSVAFRQAEKLKIKKLLPDTVALNGTDFRYNFFVLFQNKFVEFQAEYLNANLNAKNAKGYYFLSALNINKHQIVLSYETYTDMIGKTNDEAYYRIGYNYLINKGKIKIMFDNYFQIFDNNIQNYTASIQLQLFF